MKSYFDMELKAACQPVISLWKSALAQSPWLSPTPGLSMRTVANPDRSMRRPSRMPKPSSGLGSGLSMVSQLNQPTKKIAGTLLLALLGRVMKVRSFSPRLLVTQSYRTSALGKCSRLGDTCWLAVPNVTNIASARRTIDMIDLPLFAVGDSHL